MSRVAENDLGGVAELIDRPTLTPLQDYMVQYLKSFGSFFRFEWIVCKTEGKKTAGGN